MTHGCHPLHAWLRDGEDGRCLAQAIVNSGFSLPHDRVVINLAPAELPKQAASFDLAITLGILAGSGQFASERFEQYAVVGELSVYISPHPTVDPAAPLQRNMLFRRGSAAVSAIDPASFLLIA